MAMSPRARVLLFIGVFTVFVVGATLAAYAAWHREGVIEVGDARHLDPVTPRPDTLQRSMTRQTPRCDRG